MTKLANPSPLNPNSMEYVRNIAKQMLKNHMFIGRFNEKRFVEPLNAYRDVIKVEDDETKFITDLKTVRKRLVNTVPSETWIGITEPDMIGTPVGYNLWVQLKEEIFGCYWFNVENVKFSDKEIHLKLKTVREVSVERSFNKSKDNTEETRNKSENSFLDETSAALKQQFSHFFREIATLSNIKEAIVFLFLALATFCTFIVQTSQWLLEYFLKLIREFSSLIRVLTPIFDSFFRMIVQIINGFYFLVAMMWRDSKTSKSQLSHSYSRERQPSLSPPKRRLPIGFRQNQSYYVTEVE